jgi:hypothetical protein
MRTIAAKPVGIRGLTAVFDRNNEIDWWTKVRVPLRQGVSHSLP